MPQIILDTRAESGSIPQSDKISCYIVSSDINAEILRQLKQSQKMILSFGADSLEFCRRENIDGIFVELDEKKPVKSQLKPLREALKHKTLGVLIPIRRHEAMLVGEVEPEFIAFKQGDDVEHDKSILSWYNELFLIPSALYYNGSKEDLGEYVVDFVILTAKNFKNFGC